MTDCHDDWCLVTDLHVPSSSPKSLPLPSYLLLLRPMPGKNLFIKWRQQEQHVQSLRSPEYVRFLSQATRGSATKCGRRLQLQLPGGGQAEASQAGEWGEPICIRKLSREKLSWEKLLREKLSQQKKSRTKLSPKTPCHLCDDSWHISHLYWKWIQLHLTSRSEISSCFPVWWRQRGGWGNLQLPHTRGWGGGGGLHCQWERIFPIGEIWSTIIMHIKGAICKAWKHFLHQYLDFPCHHKPFLYN